MAMEAGLDTGPVLMERRLPIGLLDNAAVVGERLSRLTAELLVEAMPRIAAAGHGPKEERWQRLGLQPQSSEGISYARLLRKEDYQIAWDATALSIHRQVMALYPGAHTRWRGQRIKLLATEPLVERLRDQLSPGAAALCGRWPAGGQRPGDVLSVESGEGLVVASAGCPLLLRQAQLEGKRACSGQGLIQQLNAQPGDCFGGGEESASQGR